VEHRVHQVDDAAGAEDVAELGQEFALDVADAHL